MIRLTLGEASRWLTGKSLGGVLAGRQICGVSTDTRTLHRGDLFVALRAGRLPALGVGTASGARQAGDGHDFLREAFRRGACGALVERGHPSLAKEASSWRAPMIAVADTGKGLLELARLTRLRLRARVVAVTGSCGKTTTKEMLSRILARHGRTVASPKSFNNAIGVPLTIFRADEGTRYLVVEIGTNAPGEIALLARTARPHVAVVTTVSVAHLAGLGSLKGVLREKTSIWRFLAPGGAAVYNKDRIPRAAVRRRWKGRALSFSVEDPTADLSARDISPSAGGTRFSVGRARVRLRLPGLHNVSNALAALAVCRGLGLPLARAAQDLGALKPLPGRLVRVRRGGIEILDDSYNANPASMEAALAVLEEPWADGRGGRRVAVLGEMGELGGASRITHAALGRRLARGRVDIFWGVGEAMRGAVRAARGAPKGTAIRWQPDAAMAARRLPRILRPRDRVLVKGSRHMGMERVVAAILGFARK